MERNAVLVKFRAALEEALKDKIDALENARQTFIDAPGPMQSGSDTTRFQVSSFAENIARGVEHLQNAIATLNRLLNNETVAATTVREGAVVQIAPTESSSSMYLAVFSSDVGGLAVEHEGHRITAITKDAPVAQAMYGKSEGEEFTLSTGNQNKRMRVISII